MHSHTYHPKIEQLFSQLKYSEIDDSEGLEFLSNILTTLCDLDWGEFQKEHFLASQELQNIGTETLPLLLKYLLDHTRALADSSPIKSQDNNIKTCGKNKYFHFYKSAIRKNPREIRISKFLIPEVTKKEAEQYKNWTISLLDNTITTPIDSEHTDDITTALALLSLLRQLCKKTAEPEIFYFYCDSVLDRLVRDGNNQIARDIAEEIISCSILDNLKAYGHWCKMSLLTRQKNPIEAAFNGCLLHHSLGKNPKLPEQSLYRILKSSLILFRDCGLLHLLEDIQKTVSSYTFLGQYDRESLIVMAIYDKLLHSPSDAAKAAEQYAQEHIKTLLKSGKPAVESWYAIICNCINHVPEMLSNHPALAEIYIQAESILGTTHTERLRGMILSSQSNTKDILTAKLTKLHSTRNKTDHIHEINLLQLTANNLISNALKQKDFEGILIGHQVKSDGALAFRLSPGLPSDSLIKLGFDTSQSNTPPPEKHKDILKEIKSTKSNNLTWIGENQQTIYSLQFKNDEFNLQHCAEENLMDQWSKWMEQELPNLGFEDAPQTTPFETREDIWQKQSLSIASKIPTTSVLQANEEAVIFTDIETSRIPHNLLLSPKTPLAICNSLTFDLYKSYKSIKINTNSISIWAPLKEKDGAIEMAHARLTEYFPTETTEYHTDSMPPLTDQSDIKIFVCHGGRNRGGGFKGLYPSREKEFTSKHIFGSGKIAILFICHGGHIHPSTYARTLHTLTKTLLLDGYQSVISSAWSLNVVIPGPWLSSFIESVQGGESINRAVQHANAAIKRIYPVESAWAAMHLFGNPHVKS